LDIIISSKNSSKEVQNFICFTWEDGSD